uniref:Salivary protein 15 n=1 Tax=Anopheles funestus TaxID=62324 RepID=A0A182RCG8_ANOFN
MQFYSGKLFKIALIVTVCCVLLCSHSAEANPLPGKGSKTLASKSSSNTKKQNAPKHSLGTGARTGLIGAGVGGAVLTSLI